MFHCVFESVESALYPPPQFKEKAQAYRGFEVVASLNLPPLFRDQIAHECFLFLQFVLGHGDLRAAEFIQWHVLHDAPALAGAADRVAEHQTLLDAVAAVGANGHAGPIAVRCRVHERADGVNRRVRRARCAGETARFDDGRATLLHGADEIFFQPLAVLDYIGHGTKAPYPIQHSGGREGDATTALRSNPHRLHLGLIGLALMKENGSEVSLEDLTMIHQELDLWSGKIESTYKIEGVPVRVILFGHQQDDKISVRIESPLIQQERLWIKFDFPYGKDCHVCPG